MVALRQKTTFPKPPYSCLGHVTDCGHGLWVGIVLQLLETESGNEEALYFSAFLLAWRQMYWLEVEHKMDH